MTQSNLYHIETNAIHGGWSHDTATGARAVPIYQTVAYQFKNTRHAANLFALKEPGYIYSRFTNPTVDALEKRVAALDEGVGAVAVASGLAAIVLSILNLAGAGDEVVSADNLYGGTYGLFRHTFSRLGIQVKFVRSANLKGFQKAITRKTKAIYAESIGNPKLNVTDLEPLAEIAHKHKVPFILDNTVSPYLLQPFKYGVDIAVYSATKFMGGHGVALGGLIVDSGNFSWSVSKFPQLAKADPGSHNLNFVRAFGKQAYVMRTKMSLLRDLGVSIAPFNAFLILQGIETLPMRMRLHSENALKVAQYLKGHKRVLWVRYPGLDTSPENTRAEKYLPQGSGAMIGFGIKGGTCAGKRFIESLELVSHIANIGDTQSMAIHPATTTHKQLSIKQQRETGVSPDYIRLCIGLEHIDDIIGDIDQALKKAYHRMR